MGPKIPRFGLCAKALGKLCTWENLPLHLEEQPNLTAFMRTVDPRYPRISRRSVTRSVEEQADEVVNPYVVQCRGLVQRQTFLSHATFGF